MLEYNSIMRAMEVSYRNWWLVLGLITLTYSLPVEKAVEDPVHQLTELKLKLESLEHVLASLNQDIEHYVSDQLQDSLHTLKRSDIQQPEVASPDTDPALNDFIQQLTPEQKVVIQHMGSKLKYLQAVLNEPSAEPNPGEETVYITAQKKSDIPENVQQVKEFQMSRRSEMPGPETPAETDQELQQFEDQLSPEDLALLKKMSGKVKYLQGVLHEPQHASNPGETPQDLQERSETKREQPTNTVNQEIVFTAEDRKLLQTINVKLSELQKSLAMFKKNKQEQQQNPQKQQQGSPKKNTIPEKKSHKTGVVSKRVLSDLNVAAANGLNLNELLNKCVGAKCDEVKVAKKCECTCNQPECDCSECHQVPGKVFKRVLSNLNVAAANGLNLKELLIALNKVKNRKRRFLE